MKFNFLDKSKFFYFDNQISGITDQSSENVIIPSEVNPILNITDEGITVFNKNKFSIQKFDLTSDFYLEVTFKALQEEVNLNVIDGIVIGKNSIKIFDQIIPISKIASNEFVTVVISNLHSKTFCSVSYETNSEKYIFKKIDLKEKLDLNAIFESNDVMNNSYIVSSFELQNILEEAKQKEETPLVVESELEVSIDEESKEEQEVILEEQTNTVSDVVAGYMSDNTEQNSVLEYTFTDMINYAFQNGIINDINNITEEVRLKMVYYFLASKPEYKNKTQEQIYKDALYFIFSLSKKSELKNASFKFKDDQNYFSFDFGVLNNENITNEIILHLLVSENALWKDKFEKK